MPVFTPPVVRDNPPILPTSRGQERALYKFYPNGARYVVVYRLSNGVFVQDTATDENSNTDIPQPYNVNEPHGLMASETHYDYDLDQPVANDFYLPVWIEKQYACAPQEVSIGEAALLSAAGYGGNIT